MKGIRKRKIHLWALAVLCLSIASCSGQKRDWESAKKTGASWSYESYLQKYPQGKFVAEAKQALEDLAFAEAAAGNTVESYQNFLTKYPEGRLAQKARDACDDLDWKAATLTPSWPAWEKYLSAYPQGRHSEEARSKISILQLARSAEFRNIQTVRIIVRQTFDEPVKDVDIGFASNIEALLPYFGLKSAGTETPADATLTVNCYAEALGASYSRFGIGPGTYYYTGSRVSGRVVLEAAGIPPIRENFAGEHPVPYSTLGGSTDPSGAPYDSAMAKEFPKKAIRLLARAFGYLPLIGVLSSGLSEDAILALQNAGEAMRGPLIEALSHPNSAVRTGAAEALMGHKHLQTVDALMKCLELEGESEAMLRETAARSLAAMPALSMPSLQNAAKDSRPLVRAGTAIALGRIRTAPSLSLLVALSDDPDTTVRDNAIDAIGEHRSRQAVSVLIEKLAGPKEEIRGSCLGAIEMSLPADVGGEESETPEPSFSWDVDLAGRLMKTAPAVLKSSGLSDRLVEVLRQIGDPAVLPAIQALKSDLPETRSFAAQALAALGDSRAIAPLAAAAADVDKDVRLQIAKALPSMNDEKAIGPLSRLLLDPVPDVQKAALSGLRSSLGLSDSRTEYKRNLSSPKSIEILVNFMNISGANDIDLRDAASEVLARIGKPAVEALIACLKHQNRFVQEGGVSALGATRDERAVTSLVEFAKDTAVEADNELMILLYKALGESNSAKALNPLIGGLKDKTTERKRAAVEALQSLRNIRAVDGLIAAKTEENADIDSEIHTALQALTENYVEESEFDWKGWWEKNRKRFGLK